MIDDVFSLWDQELAEFDTPIWHQLVIELGWPFDDGVIL